MQAWRNDPALGKNHKEATKVIRVPDGATDKDFMEACWPDGVVKKLKGITVKWWKKNQDKQATPAAWQITHPETQSIITVKKRMDRHELSSMYEQGKQILQVRPDGWTGTPEEKTQKAAEFMQRIAKKYVQDKVDKDGLKSLRNKLLDKVPGYWDTLKKVQQRELEERKGPLRNQAE